MSDIFQEVDEEVRRERFTKLWQRYGNYLVALCFLIVAGVGGWRGYQYWHEKQAAISGAAFEQATALREAGKYQEAETAFAKLATDGTAGYRVLAGLLEAAELARTDNKAAIAAYDRIAANKSAGPAIQDLAAIRAGYLLVDSTPYVEIRTRLEPLTAGDRVFRHSAREILALSAYKSGDLAAAKQWADLIVTDPQTPSGLRSRVEVLSQLISAASAKG